MAGGLGGWPRWPRLGRRVGPAPERGLGAAVVSADVALNLAGLLRDRIGELELRLADVAEVVAEVREGRSTPGRELAFLSALDHALRGDPGHLDRDEWQERRVRALEDRWGDLDLESEKGAV